MLPNYGYKDASGDFFVTIDTDKCDGCGTLQKARIEFHESGQVYH
jgi:hypothetical protein